LKHEYLKCPVCGTDNSPHSESCQFCGHIFDETERSAIAGVGDYNKLNMPASVLNETQGEKILKSQPLVSSKGSRNFSNGTLCLTNKRLVFIPLEGKVASRNAASEEKSIKESLNKPENISIPFETVESAIGKRGIVRPSLLVVWQDRQSAKSTEQTEFIQRIRTARFGEIGADINDWGNLIEKGKNSDIGAEDQTTEQVEGLQYDSENLESRVLEALSDMQWKGVLQIESEIADRYNANLDPDHVEAACKNLVKDKRLEQDKSGMFFKRLGK